MGCDLHCCIEYKESRRPDGSLRFRKHGDKFILSRDYDLFGLMAGVRSDGRVEPFAQPKGWPDDISSAVLERSTYRIDDDAAARELDGYCSSGDAQEWIDAGHSTLIACGMVTNPDTHSESWLSVGELAEVQERYCKLVNHQHGELAAIISSMRELDGDQEGRSRLVFWFKG